MGFVFDNSHGLDTRLEYGTLQRLDRLRFVWLMQPVAVIMVVDIVVLAVPGETANCIAPTIRHRKSWTHKNLLISKSMAFFMGYWASSEEYIVLVKT